jgi:hypothetical protein
MSTLIHVHSDGFKERVLAVKEYRTYPPGFYSQTRWAVVLRARRGVGGSWELVPLSELVAEI